MLTNDLDSHLQNKITTSCNVEQLESHWPVCEIIEQFWVIL